MVPYITEVEIAESTAPLAPSMLTARQAASYLGVPLRTFYGLVLPCYRYAKRCTRWSLQDLEAFKSACRFTSIAPKPVGVSVSTVSLRDDDTALRNSLRRAGAALKPKPTIARKAHVYMPRQRAFKSVH
jgi:hypothetical protein